MNTSDGVSMVSAILSTGEGLLCDGEFEHWVYVVTDTGKLSGHWQGTIASCKRELAALRANGRHSSVKIGMCSDATFWLAFWGDQ